MAKAQAISKAEAQKMKRKEEAYKEKVGLSYAKPRRFGEARLG